MEIKTSTINKYTWFGNWCLMTLSTIF